jgi:hypothetical protein
MAAASEKQLTAKQGPTYTTYSPRRILLGQFSRLYIEGGKLNPGDGGDDRDLLDVNT